MNPELPAPQASLEASSDQKVLDTHENGHFDAGELASDRGYEREQSMRQVDRGDSLSEPANTSTVQPVPVPVPVPQQVSDNSTVGPTIANDDDLIEKEWVDKAKKIITATQNDPYQREQEVAKLQVDYLRKRYGKELGTSN